MKKKIFVYLFLFLFLIAAAFGSSLSVVKSDNKIFKQNQNFSLSFNVFSSSGGILLNSDSSCLINVYDPSGVNLLSSSLSDSGVYDKKVDLNSSFSSIDKVYSFITSCNSSTESGFLSSSYEVTGSGYIQSQGSGVLVALMMIPLVMGLFLIIGSFTLGDDHIALRLFMFFLSPIMVLISLHIGMISLIKYYGMIDLQNLIGDVTYWFGLLIFVLVLYLIGYFIYKAIHTAAQNKKERLKY